MLTKNPTHLSAPKALLESLVEVTRFCAQQGWTPATSSNFSVRCPQHLDHLWVTVSGKDKGQLSVDDFMATTQQGQPVWSDTNLRPSAETLLHGVIYHHVPWAGCVLHTHSAYATVLSQAWETQGSFPLGQFEILKGLRGVTTHQTNLSLPIFNNSQDMPNLAQQLTERFEEARPVHGFLLAGHGIYVWGETPAEARRHLEVYEFLFQCHTIGNTYGHPHHSR